MEDVNSKVGAWCLDTPVSNGQQCFVLISAFISSLKSYNIADYFDLSREVVALGMLLFDRFFAVERCRPSSDSVLLTSIATLQISIKMRESAVIKLSTLSWFGRGRFSESQIAEQELQVLVKSRWFMNPPTACSFVMHLLLLLPDISLDVKSEVLDTSRFMAGRCMCDAS